MWMFADNHPWMFLGWVSLSTLAIVHVLSSVFCVALEWMRNRSRRP